jgi:hypothetical protein
VQRFVWLVSALPVSAVQDLCQRGAAEKPIRRSQCLGDLEVIVAVAHQQPDRLAGGAQGAGEIAALALEFRSFLTTVRSIPEQIQLVIVRDICGTVGRLKDHRFYRGFFKYCDRKHLHQCVE